MAILHRIEVNAIVELVDHLPEQRPGLHVVVGILERAADELMARRAAFEFLESGEQLVVDEFLEAVAGDAFRVGGPVAPAEFLRQGRAVVVARGFHFLFLRVEDFQEQ